MTKRNHLTDSQMDLYDYMHWISEENYCASWLVDLEFAIWAAMQGDDSSYFGDRIEPRILRRCKLLSDEVGGWLYWADDRTNPGLPHDAWGPRFAPMPQWLAMVAQRKLATPP